MQYYNVSIMLNLMSINRHVVDRELKKIVRTKSMNMLPGKLYIHYNVVV